MGATNTRTRPPCSPDGHLNQQRRCSSSKASPPTTPDNGCNRIRTELMCPICHDLLIKTVVISECGHAFCGPCLRVWLGKSRTCPECRAEVKLEPTRCRVFDTLVEKIVPASPTGTRVRRVAEWNAQPDQPPIMSHLICSPKSPRAGWVAEYAIESELCSCCGIEADTGSVMLVKRTMGIDVARFRLRCCQRQLGHASFNLAVNTNHLRPMDVANFRNIPMSA